LDEGNKEEEDEDSLLDEEEDDDDDDDMVFAGCQTVPISESIVCFKV
jgi:hypothetical protein